MSGITPLIDTLLHQVLGKRADVPLPRELNAPVTPISPEDALQALKGDSRLEPRRQATPTEQGGADRKAPPAPSITAGRAASESAQVHFSASARAIAQVLARLPGQAFPGQPSVLGLSKPLMDTDSPTSQQLAQQLQASIRDSGLFYESHLARWFRGELPRRQLEREPQMQRQAAVSERQANALLVSMDEPDSELQTILRHQLEMLALPVLRWEGEAWSGLFMALTVMPPAQHGDAEEGEGEAPTKEEESSAWQSELALTLQRLGRLKVKLRLDAKGVDLTLFAEDPEVVRVLRGGQESLRSRLQGSGIGEVALHILQQPETSQGESLS
ncbi:flagellar hook-length control protein FliK [Pistricoccus aurantiacus]|uniref:Flagellar hook-length control protein FliK n=1 Tax=Pistricoccus aurantiacus TaxID=1883414 RepID=A0A5B8SZV5_9GAMM|nr:flagellar hook-length control protein FliK [Pistricoccus aurantiacus]QEA40270.1 flagellar hook-length control protein FliK [Pistricoccus aurantiacus]